MFSDADLSPVEQQLIQLLRDPVTAVPPAAAGSLLALAEKNRLHLVAIRRLAEASGWDSLPAEWTATYQAADSRISAFLAELDRVAQLAATANLPVAVLENGALARARYAPPGDFSFGDFDLLVAPANLAALHKLLLAAGYRLLSQANDGRPDFSAGRLEYVRQSAGDCTLRLNSQTQLVARRWFDAGSREPDPVHLLERSIPLPGSAARMLSPADCLFQLAIHNASHGYVRKPGLSLHLDVDRIVRAGPIDWSHFLAQAGALGVKTAVYFALRIPRDLFGTPIPDEVLAALRPPGWQARLLAGMIRRAGLLDPNGRKFSRPGFILFTALLYDDLAGLWRGIFPDAAWMRRRYAIRHGALLPYYHLRRLGDLVWRRRL